MAHHNYQVTMYEAHTYVGGCASYFKRHKFKFDAGATTLSGLGTGRPLRILCDQLNISLPSIKLDHPMRIHLTDNTIIERFADLDKFIEVLDNEFPKVDNKAFWYGLKEREENLWSVLGAGQHFPPKSIKDISKLLRPKVLAKAPLGLWAFTPFIKTLPKGIRNNPRYMDLINQQLLISTQSLASEVPALLAAMGLIYPDDMHYSFGGMASLAEALSDFIIQKGGEVHKRHRVIEVKESGLRLKVHGINPTKKPFEKEADIVVSNLTIWDTPKLFKGDLKQLFPMPKERSAWGAITAYFSIKGEKSVSPLYHQIHIKDELLGNGSLFFSFSHPDDSERAPLGHQTVTVSTHTQSDHWQQFFENGDYEENKERIRKRILEIFNQKFLNYETGKVEVGTPHTFERFTSRHKGLVGGLPHNLRNNILTFPEQRTPLDGFYQIGDTTFPGQGIVGVTTGAFLLAGKLLGKNFLE
ncbi:MAG: NAD(P)/FAD-dependent oxidoreductase [Bacteriovoracaceae bacterium]|nr:NAD(P)/FAD-dependent oxidoreductase [Bacteriovoracaceae bacterium]